MKKIYALLGVLMLICTVFCACKTDKTENGLVGNWNCTVENETITILLNADGTGHLSAIGGLISYNFSYTTEEGKISFDAESDIFEGKKLNYTLEGDKLTLTNEDEHLEFTRE